MDAAHRNGDSEGECGKRDGGGGIDQMNGEGR